VRHGTGWYYMYLWRDDIFWGSATYPIASPFFIQASPFGQQINGAFSRPRALPPSAVNPTNGTVNAPTSLTLQWTDGLDNQRRDPNWSVTYDIYASGNEFPELLVFSNIPCNGVGTCSVNVSNLVYTTRYQWRVVAKMRSAIFVPPDDNLYLTSSPTLRFSTRMDPSTPSYSFRTFNGSYLTAPGGGGGNFQATATSIDWQSIFKIIDINGGVLMSGDAVHIQTNRNFFLMAYNGGGSGVTANSGWAMQWETFTIQNVNGSVGIGAGDQISLRSSNGNHYLVAEGGGGGIVNCDRGSVGMWETFTLVVN
jgi:hypothetical protein